jgi:hypothetical protein
MLTRAITFLGIVLLAAVYAFAADPKPGEPGPSAAVDRATLEKRFAERMTNVALVGHFTDSNRKPSDLNEEKYIIEKVVKDKGDDWLMTVRIQYGKHNLPVTLKIPVLWAGDTPVLSVTNLAVPLLGTFNARVVLHDGQYAGTWSGAGHGGHLFGKIVKNTPAPNAKTSDKDETQRPKDRGKQ